MGIRTAKVLSDKSISSERRLRIDYIDDIITKWHVACVTNSADGMTYTAK